MPISKFLIVATEGQTIDGREITAKQIDQMAANYDPKKYGARVWLEHYRSLLPDSPFKAYGDVLAVKADTNAEGKRVLLAQIDATSDLVKMNTDRQKVFWSIELDPNFAGTGEAYLAGLAVTDTPASLGTEMLTFAAKSANAPEALKSHLFTAFSESALDIEEAAKPEGPGLMARVKELLSGKGKSDDARFTQLEGAVTAVAEEVAAIKGAADNFAKADSVKAMSADVTALKTQLTELTTKLSQTPDSPPRPQTSGGPVPQTTDC